MAHHELKLPELGIDDVPIVISLWLVEAGSRVDAGEEVVEILSGGVTVDLPSPVDGLLVETLVDEEEEVTVGQALAVIEG
jgi:pyruvate/2-oxoglutarate dehydrogenase complex dihydrolipoamide acyltransferase (E2) component